MVWFVTQMKSVSSAWGGVGRRRLLLTGPIGPGGRAAAGRCGHSSQKEESDPA